MDEIILPHRPNYGKMGKQVVVTTNHYKADFNRNQQLYQYDVSLEGFEKTALVCFLCVRRFDVSTFYARKDLIFVVGTHRCLLVERSLRQQCFVLAGVRFAHTLPTFMFRRRVLVSRVCW